jgi:L-ascorbate metabolism protein UlaG (beta-lactamase superfamily)
MEITYYGHSCFKIKGTEGTVITDPFNAYVGFTLPTVSADVVTVSHNHKDHAEFSQVGGTARRKKPFIIEKPGEYEVGGVSVFGVETFHDDHQGTERGPNIVFTIMIDNIRVCHLGDLGHELTSDQLSAIGSADVVLCPVGGVFSIGARTAVKTIHSLEPSIAIPMHFKTDEHDQSVFGELDTLEDFLKEYGAEAKPESKLKLEQERLPEETELVVLLKQ